MKSKCLSLSISSRYNFDQDSLSITSCQHSPRPDFIVHFLPWFASTINRFLRKDFQGFNPLRDFYTLVLFPCDNSVRRQTGLGPQSVIRIGQCITESCKHHRVIAPIRAQASIAIAASGTNRHIDVDFVTLCQFPLRFQRIREGDSLMKKRSISKGSPASFGHCFQWSLADLQSL